MTDIPPPHYYSRKWTGDIVPREPEAKPVLRRPRLAPLDPERARTRAMLFLLLLVLMTMSWLVSRAPGAVPPDFAVAVATHHNQVMTWLNWGMVASVALLLLSRNLPSPRLIRLMLVLFAIGAVVTGFVECRLVAEAHSHAVFRGARHPMLLASTDSCGRRWGKPGAPCVHSFRLWDGRSAYDVQGFDYPLVRACVLVQRVVDRTGFIWAEVVAELDPHAETDENGDITQQAQRDCLNGMKAS